MSFGTFIITLSEILKIGKKIYITQIFMVVMIENPGNRTNSHVGRGMACRAHTEYAKINEGTACRAPSAPASVHSQRGESPLQVYALRPVAESNCVAAMRGGKQLEANDRSVG
jgi:hypothetical protein